MHAAEGPERVDRAVVSSPLSINPKNMAPECFDFRVVSRYAARGRVGVRLSVFHSISVSEVLWRRPQYSSILDTQSKIRIATVLARSSTMGRRKLRRGTCIQMQFLLAVCSLASRSTNRRVRWNFHSGQKPLHSGAVRAVARAAVN